MGEVMRMSDRVVKNDHPAWPFYFFRSVGGNNQNAL